MNAFTGTRKTRTVVAGLSALGAGGLLAAGLAMPATAADWSNDESTTSTSTWTDILNDVVGTISLDNLGTDVVGDVTGDVANGDLTNEAPVTVNPGDIASGPIGSGNQIGDIGSGNAVGSGNDVQAPIGSGNETNVDLGGVDADVNDVVGDVTGSVDGIAEDVTGSVDVGGIVDDVTGAIDLGGLGN